MTYNWLAYNGSKIPTSIDLDKVMFNGFSLTNKTLWICIQTLNNNTLANINFKTFFAMNVNWWWILNKTYTNNILNFTISFISDSNIWLIKLIDTFKKNTRVNEWILDIDIWWWERRTAKATLTKLNIPSIRVTQTRIAEITWTFELLDPFFVKKDYNSNLFENVSSNIVLDLDNQWSYQVFPLINFIIKTATDLNTITINIWWSNLIINQSLVAWDFLQYNWIEKTLKLNNVEIDFTWVFQELDTWYTSIWVDFNSWVTNLNLDIAVLFNEIQL